MVSYEVVTKWIKEASLLALTSERCETPDTLHIKFEKESKIGELTIWREPAFLHLIVCDLDAEQITYERDGICWSAGLPASELTTFLKFFR